MFVTYVLRSLHDQKFYIGHTDDLKDRMRRHNEGRVPATKGRRPLVLIYSEEYPTKVEAVRRERYLKGLKGNWKFKQIIGV
ncbi:MAG TPA: GIY-YIG nuclease family protein [Bacteroidota bacterium]|nr:GIY-YIG nuclease family protein [Bacteroidota bacterium]